MEFNLSDMFSRNKHKQVFDIMVNYIIFWESPRHLCIRHNDAKENVAYDILRQTILPPRLYENNIFGRSGQQKTPNFY